MLSDKQKNINLRSVPMKQQVYGLIRDEILSGHFPLGSQLSEKNIAAALNVSRTPVREALLVLKTEGLVEIIPQSGTYVFRPTREEVINICEMRLILESAAIRLAIKSNDQDLFKEMKQNVADAKKVLKEDLEECHRHDTRFHSLVIEAGLNPYLLQAYTTISNRMHALRQLLPLTKQRLSSAVAQHAELLDCIKNGDEEAALKLISDHILHVQEMLLEKVE